MANKLWNAFLFLSVFTVLIFCLSWWKVLKYFINTMEQINPLMKENTWYFLSINLDSSLTTKWCFEWKFIDVTLVTFYKLEIKCHHAWMAPG